MSSSPVLAIGPANYAGQAYEWAEAVNRNLPAAAWSFARGPVRESGFGFPTHHSIHPIPFYVGVGRGMRSRWLLHGATHVAVDGYEPFYRYPHAPTVLRDMRLLERQGKQVALIAHGTDVRDPVQHRERLRWSFFNEGDDAWFTSLASSTGRNRREALELGCPLFVSTPDLLLDQPTATWLPLSIDVRSWESGAPVLERAVPRVLHLPSRRHPPIKGTQYVDPVMRGFERRGLIEYVSPDSVPHREVKQLVHSVDIVVDQILTGSYGVAAVEAMAAGRVVIGGLAPDVSARMPDVPGLVDADPLTLETRLMEILDDREQARARARGNLDFVRRWHDGRAAAAALESYLGLRSAAT